MSTANWYTAAPDTLPPIMLHPERALEVLYVHGPVIGAAYGRPFLQKEARLENGDKIILYIYPILI
jgi:hypothetical protein